MSIKSKAAAAAATLTLVGGLGMAGALTAGTASAATPSAGPSAIDVFSKQFGTHRSPNFVVDVLRQGEKTGQPIILFRTANFDPAEDWTVSFQGTTADFFAAGLVGAAVALHYGCIATVNFPDCYGIDTPGFAVNDPAFEIETRLTAWTAVCAWALPAPRWRKRALPSSHVASPPRPCGSRTSSTRRRPCSTATSR